MEDKAFDQEYDRAKRAAARADRLNRAHKSARAKPLGRGFRIKELDVKDGPERRGQQRRNAKGPKQAEIESVASRLKLLSMRRRKPRVSPLN